MPPTRDNPVSDLKAERLLHVNVSDQPLSKRFPKGVQTDTGSIAALHAGSARYVICTIVVVLPA